jgi:glutamate-1-semialdehyde aminotransferase
VFKKEIKMPRKMTFSIYSKDQTQILQFELSDMEVSRAKYKKCIREIVIKAEEEGFLSTKHRKDNLQHIEEAVSEAIIKFKENDQVRTLETLLEIDKDLPNEAINH